MYGVSRFIALPHLDQRTLAVVYLLVENEVKRRNLLHRNRAVKEDENLFTISTLQSEVWDRLLVQQLLDQPEFRALLPPHIQHLRPLVAFTHSIPIGRRVQNYKRFFSGSSVEELIQISQQPCDCHLYVHLSHNGCAYCPEGHGGHVLTADPYFAHLALPPGYGPAVVELLSLGAKYRPTGVTVMTPEHRASTMQSFTTALNAYIVALQREAEAPQTTSSPLERRSCVHSPSV
jgi:hypothetical protein